jgi:hypothetical protein
MITIGVRYTCGLCDVANVTVQIPARASVDEDLKVWMDRLTVLVGDDHRRRSPTCFARKIRQLEIPIENAAWVGGPPIQ